MRKTLALQARDGQNSCGLQASAVPFKDNETTVTTFGSCYILCIKLGFSCVAANIGKNANAACLADTYAIKLRKY